MRSPKVDGFLRKSEQWQAELSALRAILLDSPLTEDLKWRHPCYTLDGGNLVLLGRFKDSCLIHFIKGVLLPDPDSILTPLGEHSQASRVVRFTSVEQVARLEPVLRRYIADAIALERAGAKVEFKQADEFELPAELQKELDEQPALKAAFAALTPGRRRAYGLHVSSAKQSKTRAARVQKCVPLILSGKGLDD